MDWRSLPLETVRTPSTGLCDRSWSRFPSPIRSTCPLSQRAEEVTAIPPSSGTLDAGCHDREIGPRPTSESFRGREIVRRRAISRTMTVLGTILLAFALRQKPEVSDQAREGLKKAATFYRTQVARHGGYVYYTSTDLQDRWGEGKAAPDQIWVQPPGTPTVGMAYLRAHAATKDPYYLDAARDAAEALVYGQLQSGGWTNQITFGSGGGR